MNTLLVGAGYWGQNFIRILEQKNNNFKLKYILDPNIENQDYECYKSLESLNSVIDDIDAAIVCTPTKTHYEIVHFLLSNNVNVLVEKPLTTSVVEAEKLFNLANKKNKVLLTDHTFLYNSSIIYINNLVKNNVIGDLLHISFERTNLGPIRTDVSCLWDLATHDISIMNALIDDKVQNITASGFINKNSNVHDIVNISINFESKFVSIFTSWLHPEKSRKIKLVGTNKMIIYDDTNNNEPIKIYDKKLNNLSEKLNNYGSVFNFSIGDVVSPYLELKEPLVEVIKDFQSNIENNTSINKLNSQELAINTISVLEKIEKAIES
jgi:predicted dehydrogenase